MATTGKVIGRLALIGAMLGTTAIPGAASDGVRLSYSTYGVPGLLDMPTARSAPDAELTATATYFESTTRSTVSFQLAPRLTTAFRYSALEGLGGSARNNLFDRSFDVHYRVLDETARRPAVAIGLRDFIGTGVYSGEYIVATKAIGSRLEITGGVGWGRLGRRGYESRTGQTSSTAQGGQLEAARWFTGDPALFGGLAWQASDRVQMKLEYSSDSYTREEAGGTFDRRSQVNLGLDYRISDAISLQGYYLYGTTLGVSVNILNNPRDSVAPSGTHAAPFPVKPRDRTRDLGWQADAPAVADTKTALIAAMQNQGLEVEGLALTGTQAQVYITNTRYEYNAEAIGRTARVLTQTMPNSVETFVIIPVAQGLPASAVTLQRSDVERLEHAANGAEQMLARAQIGAAPKGRVKGFDSTKYPRFTWGLGPYARASFFDPDVPVLADVGLRLTGEYVISPGLFVSGSVRKTIAGNFDESDRPSNSVIQRVRSDSNIFQRDGDPALETLTLAYYFKPGVDLYGRVTAGYLEEQYGGVSAELLWKPVQSRLAIGGEVNYVRQRDFDQLFGFQDYDVVTGHMSGYYQLNNGFHAQLDVGRYLAGDWGATFSLDRAFANGWSIGAFATLTDVSFEDFGEGSFDKGLRFTIPLSPLLGTATRRKFDATLRPLTRDGGARVEVDGRLYETVREFHASGMESSWGRFWR